MQVHPFPLLKQFSERLDVTLFTKEDRMKTDEDALNLFGAVQGASLNQVHGNRTIVVREPTSRTEEADGMLTDQTELALMVRASDCQNFVFYAPRQNVLGVLHAGWRGLVAGAIPAFFEVLHNTWDTHPKDIYIGAGPSLCQKCAEFSDPERELAGHPKKFFKGRNVDLQSIADMQLREAGVLPQHIDRSPLCTKCHPETFFTYRGGDKDDVLTGLSNFLVCTLRKIEVRKM